MQLWFFAVFSREGRRGANLGGKQAWKRVHTPVFQLRDLYIKNDEIPVPQNLLNPVFLKHYKTQVTHFGGSVPTQESPLATLQKVVCLCISWHNSKAILYKLVTLKIPELLFL